MFILRDKPLFFYLILRPEFFLLNSWVEYTLGNFCLSIIAAELLSFGQALIQLVSPDLLLNITDFHYQLIVLNYVELLYYNKLVRKSEFKTSSILLSLSLTTAELFGVDGGEEWGGKGTLPSVDSHWLWGYLCGWLSCLLRNCTPSHSFVTLVAPFVELWIIQLQALTRDSETLGSVHLPAFPEKQQVVSMWPFLIWNGILHDGCAFSSFKCKMNHVNNWSYFFSSRVSDYAIICHMARAELDFSLVLFRFHLALTLKG